MEKNNKSWEKNFPLVKNNESWEKNYSLDSLDKVTRNFVWGSTKDKLKLHMVSWEKITKPKEKGGLEIQAAKTEYLALLAKLNWQFNVERDKDWVKVLAHKYRNPNRTGSCVWMGWYETREQGLCSSNQVDDGLA